MQSRAPPWAGSLATTYMASGTTAIWTRSLRFPKGFWITFGSAGRWSKPDRPSFTRRSHFRGEIADSSILRIGSLVRPIVERLQQGWVGQTLSSVNSGMIRRFLPEAQGARMRFRDKETLLSSFIQNRFES